MKINFVSDIHLDFWIKEKDTSTLKFNVKLEDFVFNILQPTPDCKNEILVIAGDTGHYNQQTKALLTMLKGMYKEILIVFGNHDMYLVSNSQVSKYNSKSTNRLQELQEICEELEIYYLDGNVVEIDGVKFGGTGSWYNLTTEWEKDTWNKVMNDSNLIYDGYAVQSYGMYQSYSQPSNNWNPIKFYDKEKAKLIRIAEEKCDVFITHMGLHEPLESEGMAPEYLDDEHNIFYYTNNEELLEKSGCKVHIFGHTHQSLDFDMNGIRMLCNPLGYKSDMTGNSIKQIEI
jgi:predicted phosphodiesterase